jgi:hypothetical protein
MSTPHKDPYNEPSRQHHNKAPLTPEQQQEQVARFQNILDRARSRFTDFAGPRVPSFRFANEHESHVKTAYFTHNRGDGKPEVVMSPDFFIQNNLTNAQVEWVMMHELGHFLDWKKSKRTYEENFVKARDLGNVLAKDLADEYKKRYSEDLPAIRVASIGAKLGEIYSSGYYNVLDDVWVNHTVQESQEFAPGTPGDVEREELYKKTLSPARNLSYHEFESYQYLYALLRGENVQEGFRITEAPEKALRQEYRVFGKTLTVKDIIDIYFNPVQEKGGRSKKTDHRTRHSVAEMTLLPAYTTLLKNDMLRVLDDYHKNPMKDFDKILSELIEKYGSMFPDFIPHEVFDEWSTYTEKKDAEERDNEMGSTPPPKREDPREAAKKRVEESMRQWREQHNIREDLHTHVTKVEHTIQQYLNELDQLWKQISTGVTVERRRGATGNHAHGARISIPQFIRQYPRVINGQADKLRVMERFDPVEQAINRPERIEVTLILDRSSSMFPWDPNSPPMDSPKNKALEEVTLLVMKSLERFNSYLDSTRDETRTKLHADTEVILYGARAEIGKPFRGEGSLGNDRVEQYKVMEQLANDMSANNEEAALQILTKDMNSEKPSLIEQKKLLKIAILITDGGTHPSEELLSQINRLTKDGVHIFALQIGKVSDQEKKLFEETWMKNRADPLGYVIGEDLSMLGPSIAKVLEDELSSVEV